MVLAEEYALKPELLGPAPDMKTISVGLRRKWAVKDLFRRTCSVNELEYPGLYQFADPRLQRSVKTNCLTL